MKCNQIKIIKLKMLTKFDLLNLSRSNFCKKIHQKWRYEALGQEKNDQIHNLRNKRVNPLYKMYIT